MLNVKNLETEEDVKKIENHFLNQPGVENVKVELSLKIVTLYYNDGVGSPHQLLRSFDTLGYPVR